MSHRTVRIKARIVDVIEMTAQKYNESFLEALYRIVLQYRDQNFLDETCPKPVVTSSLQTGLEPQQMTPVSDEDDEMFSLDNFS